MTNQGISNVNTEEGDEEAQSESLMSVPMHGSDLTPQAIACIAAGTVVLHSGAQLAFSAVLLPELMAPGSQFTINSDEASWIASIVTISTPIGSLLSGPLMDKFGRKALCQFTCVPLFISWLIIAFAKNVYTIYCGRLLAGFSAGLASAALVYISEISHPKWRSSLLCLISIFVSLGILLVCILCLWLDCQQMAIFFTLVAVSSYFVLYFLPETPHWLLRYQCKEKAVRALHWLYRRDLSYDYNLHALLKSSQPPPSTSTTNNSFFTYFLEYKKSSTLKPVLILIFIFIFQQLSGAYVVIFYAVNIIHLVGGRYGSSVNEYTAFLMLGIIRFIMSIFTAFASRRFGRRPVSMISGVGMASSALIAAVYISSGNNSGDLFESNILPVGNATTSHVTDSGDHWLPLVSFIVYVFFSSLGVLVIPWTLIGELSPTNVRGSCGGFMMAFSYTLMFAVVKAFPYLLHIVKSQGIFYIFSATSFSGAVFVFLFLPETRGKTFEEIENYFK